MADSASIGANFSDYVGNPQLGGAGMPAFQIDTRPLEQLSHYTFYYNRAKFEQKQKDLEAAAKEYASLTDYNLTNSIPKFSKEIQKKYNELYDYVQANPNVLDYKNNQKGYLEYKKKKQDFETDLLNAKSQDAINASAMAVIEKETNPKVKAFKLKQLEDQIAKVDLATPIRLQQYDTKPTVLPEVNKRVFDIQIKGPDDILFDRKITIADRKFINNTAAAMALGLMDEQLDINSDSFKKLPLDEQTFKIEENKNREATGRLSVIEDAELITEALKNPAFRDATTGKIDLTKVMASNKIIAGSMQAILDHNKVVEEEAKMIEAGAYKGNIKVLQFGINGLDKTDYQPIDYTDGEITATDLLKVQLTAKSPTTTYDTTSKELNNPLQAAAIEAANYRARLNEGGANYRAELDLIGKGWVRDVKGKMQPPTAKATTTDTNGGVVPYWENYIAPQINNANDLKIITKKGGWFSDDIKADLPKDYTGDITVQSDKISGLSIALTGELNAEGKPVSYTAKSKTKIRFANGVPIGIVINNVFYDQNDINSKATRLQDKNVNNKFDAPIFDGNTTQPLPQTQKVNSKGLPIF